MGQAKNVIDHCDDCGLEIVAGQDFWRVGKEEIYCKVSCWASSIGAITISVGDEVACNSK